MTPGVLRAVRKLVFALALSLVAFAIARPPGVAGAEPRFGDSSWVAPSVVIEGTPEDPGPRVAPKDHEWTWESVLRAPFRVAFFPLRLTARGIEATGSLAERAFPPGNLFGNANQKKRGLKFSPELLGLTVAAPSFVGPGSRVALTGTYSLNDGRRLKLRGYVGDGVSGVGAGFEAMYEHKPTRPFYGIGNFSDSRKTYYLRRTDNANVYAFVGRNHMRRARVTVGLSDVDIGRGYNAGPSAFDVFDPADVPFLTRGSQLWWYGASADLEAVDDSIGPTRGFHLRPEIRRYQSADGADVRYDQWRLEARGYLSVLAPRRVLVGRVIYEGVDPRGGSAPIPFYRLPESTDSNRFTGYPSGRFRDRRLAIARIEYRWEIERPVWAFLLGELGEVAPTPGALTLPGAHPSLGGGLRVKIGRQAARLEIARGHEGLITRADLGVEF